MAWKGPKEFRSTKEYKSVTLFNQALKIRVQNDPEEALRMREPVLGEGPIEVLERELDSKQEPANGKGTAEKRVQSFPRPAWNPDIGENLFLNDSPESIASERFRSLRTRLLRMRESRPLQTILIVSANAGEGKSVIAANLSQVMAAHASERVLLIDGDLRLPRLHDLLGAPASPGLHECLSGEAKYATSIQQSPMDGFYFLPAGDCENRSAGLLGGSAFGELLIQLRREFGWIVIDSPAALRVSDAAVLAEYCDGIVVVARSGVAKQQDLKLVCEQFEESKILGVVLNGKPLEKKDTYAYGESSKGRRTRDYAR
jgi:capsular exopolysaccharide synthesis family protein